MSELDIKDKKAPFIAPVKLEDILKEFHQFNKSHNSVVLGTVNKKGNPETSYAPTLQGTDCFYIYVSELANHTSNIFQHENVSLLFIEPEGKADNARNLFKRRRSSIDTTAKNIKRDSEEFTKIMSLYKEKFGAIMRNLSESNDFHLFKLTPTMATYIRGFGQAFHITGKHLDNIGHKNDRGHGQTKLK